AAQRAIASWHLGWGPALEASGSDWLAPFQAQLLADPYGVVRYVAAHRLRELPGFEGVRIDFLGSTNEWKAEAARVQREWKTRTPRPSRKGSEVLIGDDGDPLWDRVAALVAEQDTREMTISE
ncbi:MAG: hypothetical protein AB7J34_26090, partial [Limisphaerales bacterium]